MAMKHGAVILTPDYRLRPEHELRESVADIKSFWEWIEDDSAQRTLNTLRPEITLEKENLIVAGESAGGYLTAQTAVMGLTSLPIKVLIIQYPPLDMTEKLRLVDTSPEVLKTGLWAERVPYSEVEEHLRSLEKGKLCTRAPFASRMRLLAGMVQAGKFWDAEKDAATLDPFLALDNAGKLPPILLYHSKEDEAVSWTHTEKWAQKLKKLQPDVPLYLKYTTGCHVFDADDTMDTPWLKEPLEFVQKYWPA